MPDYDPKTYTPQFGGTIDSDGNVKNLADAIAGTGTNAKIKVDAVPQVIYMQGTEATTWTISHNLNRFPQVTTLDDTGAPISGYVQWPNLNQVIISFSTAVKGKAFLT